jgi:hypothetical protein
VNDSTAIAVVEVGRGDEVVEAWPWNGYNYEVRRTVDLHYTVRMLHRPRLGTSFPAIVAQVTSIMQDLPPMPKEAVLVFDGTGLGAPVVQMARKEGLKVISIAITAGQTALLSGRDRSVPKALLVGELRLAMHRNRLKVAEGFAARETFRDELQAFTAKLSNSGRATFESAGSEHDDTVSSPSMAVLAAKTRASARPIEFVRSYHMEK